MWVLGLVIGAVVSFFIGIFSALMDFSVHFSGFHSYRYVIGTLTAIIGLALGLRYMRMTEEIRLKDPFTKEVSGGQWEGLALASTLSFAACTWAIGFLSADLVADSIGYLSRTTLDAAGVSEDSRGRWSYLFSWPVILLLIVLYGLGSTLMSLRRGLRTEREHTIAGREQSIRRMKK